MEENYIMDMWIRDCKPGIASCYIAQVLNGLYPETAVVKGIILYASNGEYKKRIFAEQE